MIKLRVLWAYLYRKVLSRMISANNVTLRLGKKALFEEVNIKFTEGNCYGLIGANGAGKSTLFNVLTGVYVPTRGEIHFKDQPTLRFSIDIGIVTRDNNGLWNRLIHEKTGFSFTDKYYWNEVRNSKGVSDKAATLKKNNHWNDVRQRYLDIKNKYLRANDYNHPSFVCYIEAVNEIYQKFGKN